MMFRSAFLPAAILVSIASSAVAQLEPNDTCATGAVITPGTYFDSAFNEYGLTPPIDRFDVDHYRISVPPSVRLVVDVARTWSVGNPATLNIIGSDVTAGCFGSLGVGAGQNSATIVFDNTSVATRLIDVQIYALLANEGLAEIQYRIDVRLDAIACIGSPDDAYEPAPGMTTTPMGFGTVTNLFAATNREDVYSLRVPSGTTLLVRADFAHALGDLDLEVTDSAATLTSTTTTNQELVTFTTTAPISIDTVLVRVAPKAGALPLCNSYALTVEVVAPALGTSYCDAGVNGYGTEARILPSGSTSISANDLRFTCQAFPGPSSCLLVAGTQPTFTPFGDGWRCVGGTVVRLGTAFAANRVATLAPDFTTPNGSSITPGTSWNWQVYYRDLSVPGGAGFNLTDAVSIAMTP